MELTLSTLLSLRCFLRDVWSSQLCDLPPRRLRNERQTEKWKILLNSVCIMVIESARPVTLWNTPAVWITTTFPSPNMTTGQIHRDNTQRKTLCCTLSQREIHLLLPLAAINPRLSIFFDLTNPPPPTEKDNNAPHAIFPPERSIPARASASFPSLGSSQWH